LKQPSSSAEFILLVLAAQRSGTSTASSTRAAICEKFTNNFYCNESKLFQCEYENWTMYLHLHVIWHSSDDHATVLLSVSSHATTDL